jgi:hypothetical protein
MSRAYRIKVSESLRKIIKGADGVSTQLEILHVLPHEQMAELLAQELHRRGFTDCDGKLTRERDGIVITVDPEEGTVAVSVSGSENLELEMEETGWAVAEEGRHAEQARADLRKKLQGKMEKVADSVEAQLQAKLTDKLEAHLEDLRKELNEVSARVTAEALKRKAAQMGRIKEVSEDPQSGSMTIVLEV